VSWEEEQDQLTQQARLYLASPEVVFQELKKLAAVMKEKGWWNRNDTLETVLIERNDPLINLGLACYGANKEVIRALYKQSLEPPRDEADAHYKQGLRVGCLSNTTIEAARLDFPTGLIGEQETRRLLMQAKDAEITALIRNPSISDKLLESLYKRTDVFAQMPEERWCGLVELSSKNERLVTDYSDSHSPDLGFINIQNAIFNLLETAPVTLVWVRVLYDLLDQLSFQQTDTPDRIDHVLARWAQLDDRDRDGKPCEGYFTSLPLKEEFRCLIAAMYGRGFSKSKFFNHGSLSSPDIALRCAYYGKGELTAKQMKEAHEKDKEVYVFASLYNIRIYWPDALRQLFEEEQLTSDLAGKFRRQRTGPSPFCGGGHRSTSPPRAARTGNLGGRATQRQHAKSSLRDRDCNRGVIQAARRSSHATERDEAYGDYRGCGLGSVAPVVQALTTSAVAGPSVVIAHADAPGQRAEMRLCAVASVRSSRNPSCRTCLTTQS
jgi:hypothetical protein